MNNKIFVLDTTLRDGAQSAGVSFSVADKIKILHILDDLGIDFAEAGYPAVQEKDKELFEKIKAGECRLKTLKPVAFSSTCREACEPEEDKAFYDSVEIALVYLAICGKASPSQVRNVLRTEQAENLRMISESVKYAVSRGKTVIFDCEHYFDGFLEDDAYALSVAVTAQESGASRIILCDTNGGMMPEQIKLILSKTRERISIPVGIHCHNDCGLAVANTIAAVNYGATDIQGTVCGIGERCGNTDLCTVIPDLQLKLGYNVIPKECMKLLSKSARSVSDIANLQFNERSPYVGGYAFSHKAGSHIDGETKFAKAFEHCVPDDVGNTSRLLLSEQSGKAAVWERVKQIFPETDKDDARVKDVLLRIKGDEFRGCQYEDADGSLSLIILGAFSLRKCFFTLADFKIVLGNPANKEMQACAVMKITVDNTSIFTAAEGEGPVNAMDKALRDGLTRFYPCLAEMRLTDYKVRVIDSDAATAALVRVSIESADENGSWRTVGVSTDVIKASWNALCDSVEYKLSLDAELL